MTVYYLAEHLPPFHADPMVFGDWAPDQEPVYRLRAVWHCGEHLGITWRGDGPCWLCGGAPCLAASSPPPGACDARGQPQSDSEAADKASEKHAAPGHATATTTTWQTF